MGKPKAQHFIPVGHLARFGTPAGSRGPRGSVVHVFDKRSGVYRTAKAGTVALENDLYTFRLPDLTGIKPELAAMYARTFDPANKDVEIEVAKADIEARGSRAMAEIETWPTGLRHVSEDDRVSLLTYMGLLLAQHPTMMKARRLRFGNGSGCSSGPGLSNRSTSGRSTRRWPAAPPCLP